MIHAVERCWPQVPAISDCCSSSARSVTASAHTPRRRTLRGSKFLINGEPTENKLALGSKGALRFEVIAKGRMAHSAYPELGESAIEKLVDALQNLRKISCLRTLFSGRAR